MVTKYAYECIIPQLQNLKYCGYYQVDSGLPKIHKFLHKIYMRLCLIWITIFSIQEAIKMSLVLDDKEKFINILFLFLTHTDSIYKQCIFWLKEDNIEELLNIMKGPIYNQDQPEHTKFFKTITRHGILLLRSDNIMALLTCFLWAILPIVGHLHNQIIDFAFWVPFEYNKDPEFYFVTFYAFTTCSWQAFGNTTMDVFIAFLLAQCQTQLRILRTEFKIFVQRSKNESELTNESFEQVMERRFQMLLEHHNVILEFAKNIENIFSGAIFYQFLVGGWIICTSVYKMADLNPASMEFMSMMSYMYCILIEIFLYCYYGSEVTNESEMLLDAIYSMNWHELPPKFRKNIIILMERVKRPIEPLAGNIIPLSNVTFVKVIKSSYSFFALLTATNE